MIGKILILLFVLIIFRPWMTMSGTLSSGDWPYLWLEQIRQFLWLPEARFFWLAPHYQIVTKFFVEILSAHWHLVERILWFWPWILISFFSARRLTRSSLGGLIYTTNTYALMLVGGGQMGIAMAYALAPLVLARFKFQISPFNFLILNGILLATQVMFDPRVALLTLVAAGVYWIIVTRKNIKMALFWFGVPLIITAALHTYWFVPLLKNPTILSTQFQGVTSDAVKYLSFASFSNAFSLLHPNWPENIFGKIYFQKPEFLVIPILAFASLLFIKQSKERLFFALLSLLGVFLAKGINEPFGGIYVWLFEHVPGFSLFRDPTKFYLFIALAYSVLIPYTLKKLNKKIFVFIFLIFWAFTIREAISGKLTGTFKPLEVPKEYMQLKDFLLSQPNYFQTGWYPKKSRFAFESVVHPTVELSTLDKKTVTEQNISYIMVPLDVRGEYFITDRVYDDRKYQEAIKTLETVPWLVRQNEFEKLAVFKINP